MEKLCESDYQNVYRIKDGVLLIINKFEYMSFPNDAYPHVYSRKRILKQYAKGCQSELKKLTVDFTHPYEGWVLPKDSVVYGSRPVQIVPESKWDYQVKTTGTSLSGNRFEMIELLSMIDKVISESGGKYGNEMQSKGQSN